jgi:hypothetical protein
MVMASEPRRYLAYLLRVWCVTGDDGAPVWRASLEDVRTGARQGFGSLEQLLAFLLEETTAVPSPLVRHPPPRTD